MRGALLGEGTFGKVYRSKQGKRVQKVEVFNCGEGASAYKRHMQLKEWLDEIERELFFQGLCAAEGIAPHVYSETVYTNEDGTVVHETEMGSCQITLQTYIETHIEVGNQVYFTAEMVEDPDHGIVRNTWDYKFQLSGDNHRWHNMADFTNMYRYLPLREAESAIATVKTLDAMGLDHGDFKPDNFMRQYTRGKSQWFFIDFGNTQRIESTLLASMQKHGAGLNTVAFLAHLIPHDRTDIEYALSQNPYTRRRWSLKVLADRCHIHGPPETVAFLLAELRHQQNCWRHVNRDLPDVTALRLYRPDDTALRL